MLHETENLIKLGDWILSGSYTPAELDAFMIFEPKPREINAPSFRDKIVQRNLTDNIVYPALAPSIPFNAFAAQTGKGQHYGLDMLERQMRTYFLRKKAEDEKRRKEQGLPWGIRPVISVRFTICPNFFTISIKISAVPSLACSWMTGTPSWTARRGRRKSWQNPSQSSQSWAMS